MPLSTTPTLKEQRDHGTTSFPCGLYEIFEDDPWPGVKHHWHDEIEIIYFMRGSYTLELNMDSFQIQEECIYFVNPGELHAIIPHGPCQESAILFHPRILNFDGYDMIQGHLVQPLLQHQMSLPRCIYPNNPVYKEVRNEYLNIVTSFYQGGSYSTDLRESLAENLTSQLFIKAGLLKILGHLSFHHLLTKVTEPDDSRVQTLKTALTFVREHYKEKIYLKDLAKLVNMNEQYFCRFFKKAIGKSPVSYINEYRIKAAVELLRDTDLPVMDICLDCGFNNLGNFMREFKKQTGYTPLKYRKTFFTTTNPTP